MSKPKSNELHLTREYDAPVKTVWDAWNDIEQVKQWWGPRGFTLTSHSKDLRPGGIWHYTMHGPDGTDWPNKTLYHEVVQYKKLVYDHGGNDKQKPLFRVTVLFTEKNGKTILDMTMTLESAEKAKEIATFIKQAGGNSTWDRLAEYIEKQSTGKEKFVINRSFNVSIEKMYEMWSDPKHFANWMGPKGSTMEFKRTDVREGGSSFYKMIFGPMTMYGLCNYIKFKKPDQIIYTQQFCDENEKIARHPMAPTWPETMLTIVDFAAEGSDQTRVTVTWEPFNNPTAQEIETFINGRAGMTGGWTGSFDQLEEYLASQST